MIYFALIGITALFAGFIAYGFLDVSRKRKSDSHTVASAVYQYVIQICLQIMGAYMYQKLQEDTKKCREIQEQLLLNILKANKNTLYGKEHKFSEMTSREMFVKIHPLTNYENYEMYIEKMKKGDENVLTKKKPKIFAVTSGTSGRCNLLPTVNDVFTTFFFYGVAVLCHCMSQVFPDVRNLQKILKFFYAPKKRVSECGIPIGPNSSSPKHSNFALPLYTTPAVVYEITTEPEVLYIHLLFALKEKNLGIIEANFSSLIYQGFLSLCNLWPQLVDDIRYGRINANINIPDDIRKKLSEHLKPDPKRAKDLEEEFTVGFDGIAKRIWPQLSLILATETGSFKFYGRILKNYYTKNISHYSPLYAATEGLIGVNIWPASFHSVYLLVPKSLFFEFIPIEESYQKHPRTLFTDQVKEGETYELIITNTSGLMRYRIGDVVRIVRIHNETPVVEFLYRQGQLLNIRGEKITEQIFFEALLETLSKWKEKTLTDYCCAENCLMEKLAAGCDNFSPYYLVFLEFEDGGILNEDEKKQIDETLRLRHWVYESFRSKGSIAAAQVYCVSKGTFEKLRNFLLENDISSPNQIKIPRVLRNEKILKFMIDHCNNM